MKEIKAYVRRSCINKVVDQLERAGAPGITLVEIHPVGYGYEPNYFEERFEDAFKRFKHLSIVKLEVVCADQDVERFIQVVQDASSGGAKGDGMIFVSEIGTAVRIRDGARGEEAL